MEKYLVTGAVVWAVLAAAWDVWKGRIPNYLTYSGILLGLLARLLLSGWREALDGLAACLLGGGIFLLFFLVRGMGAGDVKLMAAIGAFAGLRQTVVILLTTAIAGGLLAIGYMIFYRRGLRTLQNLAALFRFHMIFGWQAHPEINLENPTAVRMPYALAIAAGTIYSFSTVLLRG